MSMIKWSTLMLTVSIRGKSKGCGISESRKCSHFLPQPIHLMRDLPTTSLVGQTFSSSKASMSRFMESIQLSKQLWKLLWTLSSCCKSWRKTLLTLMRSNQSSLWLMKTRERKSRSWFSNRDASWLSSVRLMSCRRFDSGTMVFFYCPMKKEEASTPGSRPTLWWWSSLKWPHITSFSRWLEGARDQEVCAMAHFMLWVRRSRWSYWRESSARVLLLSKKRRSWYNYWRKKRETLPSFANCQSGRMLERCLNHSMTSNVWVMNRHTWDGWRASLCEIR